MITTVLRQLLYKIFGVPLSLHLPPYIYADRTNGLHYFYILGFRLDIESVLSLIFTINLFIIAFYVYKKAHKKLK